MLILEQRVTEAKIVPTEYEAAMKHIEWCGRVCHNSRNKITDDSWRSFIESIIERNHTSVLEHSCAAAIHPTLNAPYVRRCGEIIFTNLRALMNELFLDFEECYPTVECPDPFITVEMITNRAVLAELSRHRFLSLSVLSQRYTRQFDVIEPVQGEFTLEEYAVLEQLETVYMSLKNESPQRARNILPNCTKTIIVASAFASYWSTIFDLRISKHADPQIRALMEEVKYEIGRRLA